MDGTGISSNLSLVAHIRRLSAAGSVLYIRIGASDVLRLGLTHRQEIEMYLNRIRIVGILKTSGGSPWLAPVPGSSNASITATLRAAGLEQGMDVSATIGPLGRGSDSRNSVNVVPPAVVPEEPAPRPANWVTLRIDANAAAEHVREYNSGFYRGRRNIDLDREAYERFR